MKKALFFIIFFFSGILIVDASYCTVVSGTGINIGDEVKCENENFFVIGTDEENDTITLFSRYVIGPDYKQTEEIHEVGFANQCTWEYTPGPKEVDIQQFDGPTKDYINNYGVYLKEMMKDSLIKLDLVSMNELKAIGCKINDDYTYTQDLTCTTSPLADKLINGHYWWLRSAYAQESSRVFIATDKGKLSYGGGCWFQNGVRPIVIVSTSLFNPKIISPITDGNGEIEIAENSHPGESITYKINPKEGYILKEIKVTDENGNTITITDDTFVMPNSDVKVEIIFEKEIENPYTSAKDILLIVILFLIGLSLVFITRPRYKYE